MITSTSYHPHEDASNIQWVQADTPFSPTIGFVQLTSSAPSIIQGLQELPCLDGIYTLDDTKSAMKKYKWSILLWAQATISVNRLSWKLTSCMFASRRMFVPNINRFDNKIKIFVTKIFTKIPKIGILAKKAGQPWTNISKVSCHIFEKIVQKL